jgi:hypothetical protein
MAYVRKHLINNKLQKIPLFVPHVRDKGGFFVIGCIKAIWRIFTYQEADSDILMGLFRSG